MELFLQRLNNLIRETAIKINENESIKVTASAGICSSENAGNIEELVKNADLALYKAKTNGRDRVEVFKS